MRWVLRVLATLVIAPPLYHLVLIYLASQQGQDAGTLLRGSIVELQQYYVAFSVPALALILLVLTPAEWLLRRWGLLLMTVLASPLLAWPAALAFAAFVQDAGTKGKAGLVAIAVTYGLVWGLSVRETRRRAQPVAVTDDKPIADRSVVHRSVVERPAIDTGTQVAAIVAANLAALKPDTAPSWADREPAPVAPPPERKPEPATPLLFLPQARRQGRPAPASAEPDAAPRATPSKVGDIVDRNLREAGAADMPGATSNKVAEVVAANAAAAAETVSATPDVPAATTGAEPASDEAKLGRKAAHHDTPPAGSGGPSGLTERSRPSPREKTATDAVGDVVAANATAAAAQATPDTRSLGDKIADYWTRSGGAAKPNRQETGVADKIAAYRRRIEGREPPPAAEPRPQPEDISPLDKVDQIVAVNSAEAAKARDAGARTRRDDPPPRPRDIVEAQTGAASATPAPAEADPAAPTPESPDKRMPRAKPGLELNHRNPLIDRLDADRRKP